MKKFRDETHVKRLATYTIEKQQSEREKKRWGANMTKEKEESSAAINRVASLDKQIGSSADDILFEEKRAQQSK